MVDNAYFVKSTPLIAFTGSFQYFADMLQTYWRCAWRSLMQKKYFLTNLQGFFLSHFSRTAPSNWWLIVYTLWNQLLLELSLDLFNTLKICCRHIEDVHEEIWCRKNIFWLTVCGGYQVSRTCCQVSLLSTPTLSVFHKLLIDLHANIENSSAYIYMSHVMRKPVFGVSDQVRLKPASSATDTS